MQKLQGESLTGRRRTVRFEMVNGKYRVWVAVSDTNGKSMGGESIYINPQDVPEVQIRQALDALCR